MLIQQVFVISQQPEPLLKTQRFMNGLELHLLAAENLGIQNPLGNVTVSVEIITEEDARQLTSGILHPNNM
uniref:Uncharacterized protein n=1 Tax=Plectus sambesii TaxID=2011161 RepID=A0A914VBR8_9BILA